MNQILEQRFKTEVPEIIASWFNGEKGEVQFEKQLEKGRKVDLLQKAFDCVFIIEWKSAATVTLLTDAIRNLRRHIEEFGEAGAIPVVAVPFMGEAGRQLCAGENISWLDLSGNANVTAPSRRLKIHIEGKPNLFKSAGRPKNLFAPKSSRIAREFLINPDMALTQRELARKTGLNETLTGRVVRELERENILTRDDQSGAVRVCAPELLLDAWASHYQFDKHLLIGGFSAQRTGEAVMRSLAEGLEKKGIEYAATGLAGAWLLTHFAAFRLTTFYLKEIPSSDLLKELKITGQSKSGGNVWLIVPNDDGVFAGASSHGQIRCVHPVQVYLDLKAHPERASEAAEAVRREYLRWGKLT